MKRTLLPFLFIACILSVTFSCNDDDTNITQEDERAQLNELKAEIEKLASTSVCNDRHSCNYIGLGSKACGGPWEYLVYSTSIDTQNLEELVEDYNKQEKNFNTKWGVISDCAITNPPSSLKCENNICIAVY
ncbi:hypothetical protein [uncultured Algibacter sp.]|uniref:hypothetical protein n=1 Tax=uncultured Algibacter sp. TaxID=298659 RepID=UPI002614AB2A|nr:hypothetical protein [uncultured Algibacter sp.]